MKRSRAKAVRAVVASAAEFGMIELWREDGEEAMGEVVDEEEDGDKEDEDPIKNVERNDSANRMKSERNTFCKVMTSEGRGGGAGGAGEGDDEESELEASTVSDDNDEDEEMAWEEEEETEEEEEEETPEDEEDEENEVDADREAGRAGGDDAEAEEMLGDDCGEGCGLSFQFAFLAACSSSNFFKAVWYSVSWVRYCFDCSR